MFSNGTEYKAFLATNCEDCQGYVQYEDESLDNPACEIEENIALSSVSDVPFPYNDLIENDSMGRYSCKKRLGVK